jgi:hypothetical protein
VYESLSIPQLAILPFWNVSSLFSSRFYILSPWLTGDMVALSPFFRLFPI